MSQLSKTKSLPLLPGFHPAHVTTDPSKFYRRKTHFAFHQGRPTDKFAPPLALASAEALRSQVKSGALQQAPGSAAGSTLRRSVSAMGLDATGQQRAANCGGNLRVAPAWLTHERHVLRFHGYMKEGVPGCPSEQSRVRHVQFLLYLEDGTLQVLEPKIVNSGVPQGVYLRRHQVPRADGNGVVGIEDLCAESREITLYSRRYRITGCDGFTRWFLNEVGVDAGLPEHHPKDEFTEQKEKAMEKKVPASGVHEQKKYADILLGGTKSNPLMRQMLLNDRKVLRFYCYWDDPSLYGSRNRYVLHFFLADSTIEIGEVHERNSGKDKYPLLFARGPLAKNADQLNGFPGLAQPKPVLYDASDLQVGSNITVLSRKLVLYDCDAFTREFYRLHLGCEQQFVDIKPPPAERPARVLPPHVGVGLEEDSRRNCYSLMPSVPKRDLAKLMTKSDVVLRFEAVQANPMPEHMGRQFIVGVFMGDDSVAVWEMHRRNAGFSEGKFAERGRKMNEACGRWYVPQDFFVGASVTVSATEFKLLRADEFTLKYCEENCVDFPWSDAQRVAKRVVAAVSSDLPDLATPEVLQGLMAGAGVALSDHEVVTLLRSCGTPRVEIVKEQVMSLGA